MTLPQRLGLLTFVVFVGTGCGDSGERLTFAREHLQYQPAGEVDGCKIYVYNVGGTLHSQPGVFTTCPNDLRQALGALRGK